MSLMRDRKADVLKILPLSNLSFTDLTRGMCSLGYCFLGNISKRYYDENHGKFRELSIDLDWFFDEPETFNLFIGVSIAYDLDHKILPDYYGIWVIRDYAEKNFNLGWTPEYCPEIRRRWEKV